MPMPVVKVMLRKTDLQEGGKPLRCQVKTHGNLRQVTGRWLKLILEELNYLKNQESTSRPRVRVMRVCFQLKLIFWNSLGNPKYPVRQQRPGMAGLFS